MMNIRIMHGEYEKEKDYDLFGYTYIKAEPPKKTLENFTHSKHEQGYVLRNIDPKKFAEDLRKP